MAVGRVRGRDERPGIEQKRYRPKPSASSLSASSAWTSGFDPMPMNAKGSAAPSAGSEVLLDGVLRDLLDRHAVALRPLSEPSGELLVDGDRGHLSKIRLGLWHYRDVPLCRAR